MQSVHYRTSRHLHFCFQLVGAEIRLLTNQYQELGNLAKAIPNQTLVSCATFFGVTRGRTVHFQYPLSVFEEFFKTHTHISHNFNVNMQLCHYGKLVSSAPAAF